MTDIATLSASIPILLRHASHPSGAHLLSWRPTGGHRCPVAVLPRRHGRHAGNSWRQSHCAYPGLADQNDSPARPGAGAGPHGFARTSTWTLLSATHPADTTPASFSFELHHTGETSALYPHSLCARLDVSAGSELHMSLSLTNDDDHPFAIEAAMHTYLHVGDIKDVTIEGLDGARYFDKVRARYATQRGDYKPSWGQRTASIRQHSRSASPTLSWTDASSSIRTAPAPRSCGTLGRRAAATMSDVGDGRVAVFRVRRNRRRARTGVHTVARPSSHHDTEPCRGDARLKQRR